MTISELYTLIKTEATTRKIGHAKLLSELKISAHTLEDLKHSRFLEKFENMSQRQKRQKYNITAKIAIFIKQDPEHLLKSIFPEIEPYEIMQSCQTGEKLMSAETGSETTLTTDDLTCLEQLMSSSSVPITFRDAYDYLCKFRRRDS